MKITENAIIAQMVRDAIINDPRNESRRTKGDVFSRAKIWYVRAQELRENGFFYYSTIADRPFEEFICEQESNVGILDFWYGDIVDLVQYDSERDEVVSTGVVKKIAVAPTIDGGGHAFVLFTEGDSRWVGWKELRHSRIPQEIVDLAKTQFIATHTCPLMEKEEENKENENV